MYKTLLALLFSGISLLLHADDSYVIQAHIRDVKDGTVFFLKQFSTQRIINAMRLENGKLQMKGELALYDHQRGILLLRPACGHRDDCDRREHPGLSQRLALRRSRDADAICRLSERDTNSPPKTR